MSLIDDFFTRLLKSIQIQMVVSQETSTTGKSNNSRLIWAAKIQTDLI
jgi:hypothetical protein